MLNILTLLLIAGPVCLVSAGAVRIKVIYGGGGDGPCSILDKTTNIGHLQENFDELLKSNFQTNYSCQTVAVSRKYNVCL